MLSAAPGARLAPALPSVLRALNALRLEMSATLPDASAAAALMCGSLDKVDRTRSTIHPSPSTSPFPEKHSSAGAVSCCQPVCVCVRLCKSTRSMRVIVLKGFEGLISTGTRVAHPMSSCSAVPPSCSSVLPLFRSPAAFPHQIGNCLVPVAARVSLNI